jgi:hypothetical protein
VTAATFNASQRASLYENIAKYISTQAYSPFLIAVALAPYWDEAWIGK